MHKAQGSLALLLSIVNKIYIDPKWVADEYLRRCKGAEWTEDIKEEALKCWNLERITDAKLFDKDEPPELSLSMEELLRENEGAVVSNRDDEVIILDSNEACY